MLSCGFAEAQTVWNLVGITGKKALAEFDRSREITVSTFREDDEKGVAPRALYKKYGFEEGERRV